MLNSGDFAIRIKNESLVSLVLLAVFLMPLFIVSAAQQTGDSWPMFHHDSAHSGTSNNSSSPINNQTLWKFNTGGQMGSPTISNGVIYVGSYDNRIYAFNAATGVPTVSYTHLT